MVNGDISTSYINKKLAGKKDIYCTDGAFDKICNCNINIKGIIGDLDSLKSPIPREIQTINTPNQDYTDFAKALFYLNNQGYKSVDVFGASGGEMDHFLGILNVASSTNLKLKFYDKLQEYFFIDKKVKLKNVHGKTISLIPFPTASLINASGLKYPLENYNSKLQEAISIRNEAISDTVEISCRDGKLIIFISTE